MSTIDLQLKTQWVAGGTKQQIWLPYTEYVH